VSRVRTLLTPYFTVLTLKMWAYTAKIAEICNFWYKFAQKGYTPLSDFYEIWLGGGSPRFVPTCQISSLWVKNVGGSASPPKIAKIGIFWYKFAQKGYTPLSDFLQYFAFGREPQDRTLMPNFTAIAKIAKNGNFGKNLPLGKNSGGR